MRVEVSKIICFIADKRSIPALINLLEDNESDVRWIASESLIRIGRKSIVPLLTSLRNGKLFLYPSRVNHVLQSLLTVNEKKELQVLLENLADSQEKPEISTIEASVTMNQTFRCDN
jgi:HEAT repeat protein